METYWRRFQSNGELLSRIACARSLMSQLNDKNSLFGFGHREPKHSGGDRVPASIGTPKQLAGGASRTMLRLRGRLCV